MKKIIVTSVLVLGSYFGFSQSMNNSNLYFGTKNKVGGEVNFVTKKNLLFGVGLSASLEKGGVGETYSNISFNEFPQDIYETKTTDGISFYGTIGYRIKNLLIGSKLGMTTRMIYQNRYDRFKILGTNGYYNTSAVSENGVLYGGFVSYLVKGKFGPTLGYDNFNGVNVGISFKF